MVLESQFESCASRFEALPVGAQSESYYLDTHPYKFPRFLFTVVVLPVPGPPVKIMNERSKNN